MSGSLSSKCGARNTNQLKTQWGDISLVHQYSPKNKNMRKISGVVFGSATRQWLRITTRRRRNRSPWRLTKPLTGQKRRWRKRKLEIITFWFRLFWFIILHINIFDKGGAPSSGVYWCWRGRRKKIPSELKRPVKFYFRLLPKWLVLNQFLSCLYEYSGSGHRGPSWLAWPSWGGSCYWCEEPGTLWQVTGFWRFSNFYLVCW